MERLFKIIIILFLLLPITVNAEYNEAVKACLAEAEYDVKNFDRFDWNRVSGCASDARTKIQKEKRAELKDFLKHNPRYRVPGQSLNRCWGKPREMPFESAGIEINDTEMNAWVNYKDKLPAGCYENAPWDNRDKYQRNED